MNHSIYKYKSDNPEYQPVVADRQAAPRHLHCNSQHLAKHHTGDTRAHYSRYSKIPALLKVTVVVIIFNLASLLLLLLVIKRVGGHLINVHLGVVGVL